MSAIAGVWSPGDAPRAAACCERLLDSQSLYGPDDRGARAEGDYASGRCLYRLLPEDRFDRQPLTAADGRFTLVADLRIDNRGELLADLGLGADAALADSDLLLSAWLAWGRGVLERTIGDFAFALWDSRDETLFLARDTAGERPLHYRLAPGLTAFATMAAPLAALPGLGPDVDERKIAGFLADLPDGDGRSFFAGVNALEPGHCALATRDGIAVERYWQPRRSLLRLPRDEYGEALREQLDSAVRRRLRRAGGRVGSHLSSGLDSSAVTTSAAIALAAAGERLLAFTAAPRAGFDGPVPAGRTADETAIAAATAALQANVDHRIVRPADDSALALLETSQALASQPVGHVCNNMWWQAINREARSAGVAVMLTGEAGNFTISAGGGLDTLAGLVRTGAWELWWREARALAGRGDVGWLNLLNASFAPWLPDRLYGRLRGRLPEPPPFLAPAWREAMRRQLKTAGRPVRPPRDGAERRWSMLKVADVGNHRKRSLAEWGVDERDPTNDRRLVQFCFSLPPEALLDGGVRRPALRRALAGRVPGAVVDQRLRGYQMPDWYERIGREEALAFARAMAAPGLAGSIVDFAALEAAARSWPTAGWEQRPVLFRYRRQLLRTLAVARFVNSVRSGGLG